MSYDSLLQSFQKICVLVTFAYLLTRMSFFRRLLDYSCSQRDRILILLFFGLLSLVESGLNPQQSPASSRVVAVTVAGILAGPLVGLGAAVFSGIAGLVFWGREVAVGGFAAAVGGVLGGFVAHYKPHLQSKILAGFVLGAFSHIVWLGVVFAEDTLVGTWDAQALVFGPPVIVNATAVALFLVIISDVRAQQEKIERAELARTLHLGNSVLPHLKYGLNQQSAHYIVDIIRRITQVAMVAITDKERTLAACGIKDKDVKAISLSAVRAMQKKEIVFTSDGASSFRCAAPLFYEEEVIGAVELQHDNGRRIKPELAELGQEIAQFLSMYQMQLGILQRQSEIASKAELRALQAQVHPHFLFNALNALACLCETDPKRAADVAIKLGAYYRRALRSEASIMVPLEEELTHLRSYLAIEQVRFGSKLRVNEEVEARATDKLVPLLCIQPVVENAVLHGLSTKTGKGSLRIVVRQKDKAIKCWIIDNGVGLSPEQMKSISSRSDEPHGLNILKNRLEKIYHGQAKLNLRSRSGVGTVVSLTVPIEEVPTDDSGRHCR